MSKYRRRRVHLKAHDRGDNRHAKAVAWVRKQARVRSAKAAQRQAARVRTKSQEKTPTEAVNHAH